MGTMIVQRLISDRDRDVVERACGEIDRAAVAFLPTLAPGQAAFVGVDFPFPLTVSICLISRLTQGELKPVVTSLRAQGFSLRAIARELGVRRIPSARGGKWTAGAVARVLRVLDVAQ